MRSDVLSSVVAPSRLSAIGISKTLRMESPKRSSVCPIEGRLKLRKLVTNVFSRQAVSVLGGAQYARYLCEFCRVLPGIFRTRDLRPLDNAMGSASRRFRYRGVPFLFDCPYCDLHVRDGTHAFGLVREMLIRDCYFRYHPTQVFESITTVLDVGANRGLFSVLMAGQADLVISVEAQRHFLPVIRHNMSVNNYDNYAVHCAYVGEGGALDRDEYVATTIEDLLSDHSLQEVDLIKIDIEGSEFGLFKSGGWLEKTKYLSIEVHAEHGDPRQVIKALEAHRFEYKLADAALGLTTDPAETVLVYAWRKA